MRGRGPEIFAGVTARPQPQRGATLGQSSDPRRGAKDQFSELAALFPVSETIRGGFTQIAIPNGSTFSNSAWYSLIDFDTDFPWEQEVVPFGFAYEMLSTDSSPATPASEAAWGDTTGLSAALVIGRNLPVRRGDGWVDAPCDVLGVESSSKLITNHVGRFVRTFPPGSYTGTSHKWQGAGTITPFVHRVSHGSRYGAALVIRGSQAQAGANKTINGLCTVEINVGLTRPPLDLHND